jgi:hypothetical protein
VITKKSPPELLCRVDVLRICHVLKQSNARGNPGAVTAECGGLTVFWASC